MYTNQILNLYLDPTSNTKHNPNPKPRPKPRTQLRSMSCTSQIPNFNPGPKHYPKPNPYPKSNPKPWCNNNPIFSMKYSPRNCRIITESSRGAMLQLDSPHSD